jgi:hypothetical protein
MSLPADYVQLLVEVKERIQTAQVRAAFAANSELIRLYWQIGQLLDSRQSEEGWGAAVIPRLARDLTNELPEVKGFSERNIRLMLQFYRAYPALLGPGGEFVQPPFAQLQGAVTGLFLQPLVAQLPWAHNMLMLCQNRDSVLAEYALRGIDKPIGIAGYELTRALPPTLQSVLPSIEALEAELASVPQPDQDTPKP